MQQPELIEGTYDAKASALIENVKRQNDLKARINAAAGDMQLELNDLRKEYRELEPAVIEWLEGVNEEAEAEIVAEWVKLRVETKDHPVRVESGDTEERKSIRLEPMDGEPPAHVAGQVLNVFKRRRRNERLADAVEPAPPGEAVEAERQANTERRKAAARKMRDGDGGQGENGSRPTGYPASDPNVAAARAARGSASTLRDTNRDPATKRIGAE